MDLAAAQSAAAAAAARIDADWATARKLHEVQLHALAKPSQVMAPPMPAAVQTRPQQAQKPRTSLLSRSSFLTFCLFELELWCQVYASAPVLRTELKRPAPSSEPEAKRQMLQAL